MSNKTNNVLLKNDNKRVFLEDCNITYSDKIENKSLEELKESDQISIVSDALFKTMLCNSENKMFVCKILSELLEKPYEEIMNNSENTIKTNSIKTQSILKVNEPI